MQLSASSNYVQGLLGELGSEYGFNTTSTIRSPGYNAEIGGVPNSQHISGTARDYSIRNKTNSQISAFLDRLNSEGFEAFRHKTKTGVEHIHAELPPGGDNTPGCPSWIPASLCGGYKSISKFSDLITPGGKVLADTAEQEANSWIGWVTRSALFGIALILIAIALFFAFKNEALDLIPAGKAIKAVT